MHQCTSAEQTNVNDSSDVIKPRPSRKPSSAGCTYVFPPNIFLPDALANWLKTIARWSTGSGRGPARLAHRRSKEGKIRQTVSGHITAQITLTTAKHLTLAGVRSACKVIEDPLDNDHNEEATFQPGKANVCARTSVGEGHLREMTMRVLRNR